MDQKIEIFVISNVGLSLIVDLPKILLRAHFKKGGIFLALKGLHIPAQGNALGNTLQ